MMRVRKELTKTATTTQTLWSPELEKLRKLNETMKGKQGDIKSQFKETAGPNQSVSSDDEEFWNDSDEEDGEDKKQKDDKPAVDDFDDGFQVVSSKRNK